MNGTEAFLSPTVTVTVATGQSVFVSASASLLNLASIGAAPDLMHFWIAYQPAGGTITNAAASGQDESLQPAETNLTSLSAVLSGLAPGTYQVGLACMLFQVNAAGTQAGNGSASALVFRSP